MEDADLAAAALDRTAALRRCRDVSLSACANEAGSSLARRRPDRLKATRLLARKPRHLSGSVVADPGFCSRSATRPERQSVAEFSAGDNAGAGVLTTNWSGSTGCRLHASRVRSMTRSMEAGDAGGSLGATFEARVRGGRRVEADRSRRPLAPAPGRTCQRLALQWAGGSRRRYCAVILLHCASAACLTDAIGIFAAAVRQACFALPSAVLTFVLLVVI